MEYIIDRVYIWVWTKRSIYFMDEGFFVFLPTLALDLYSGKYNAFHFNYLICKT